MVILAGRHCIFRGIHSTLKIINEKERDTFRMSDNGKIFSRQSLIKLILPLLAEQLLAVSVGLVDTLMVSQAGDAAISGVALVDNINRLIIQVLAAIATGGAVICSQYIGKKDRTNAKKASAQLHMVMVLFALIVVALSLIFTGNIIRAVFGSVEEAVSRSATIYFTVTSLSYPSLQYTTRELRYIEVRETAV